jgi:glycosyltransferase involved in cell wall biosynthesis
MLTGDGVTVVIPSLPERAELLERAVRSVERQSVPPADVIVHVDHDHAGAAAARNAALAKVTTPWVAFLDDDDTFHDNHLQVLIDGANASGADLIGTYPQPHRSGLQDALIACYKGIPVRGPVGVPWGPEQIDHMDMRKGVQCPHCRTPRCNFICVTNLVRYEFIEKVDGFPEPGSMGHDFGGWAAEDYMFLLKLLDAGAEFHHVTGKRTWTCYIR